MIITPQITQQRMVQYAIRGAIEQEKDLLKLWSHITIFVKGDCRRCMGRGFTGFDTIKKKYVICKCVEVEIDWPQDVVKGEKND